MLTLHKHRNTKNATNSQFCDLMIHLPHTLTGFLKISENKNFKCDGCNDDAIIFFLFSVINSSFIFDPETINYFITCVAETCK